MPKPPPSNFPPWAPLEMWVNRRILNESPARRYGRGKVNALLLSFTKTTALVKPMGHKHPETVPLSTVHPWWAGNPDLAALRPPK